MFPQLAGLGHSPAAEMYGIRGLDEAKRYLGDPLLRSRLFDITSVVVEQLRQGASLVTLMGSGIDALKVVSSLTLFEHVARGLAGTAAGDEYARLAAMAGEVLDRAEAQRYPRCEYTLRHVRER